MASIFKRPGSPYYFCSFRNPVGTWVKKTTKEKDRKKAQIICVTWEQAANAAIKGNLTAVQARKILAELVAMSSGEDLTTYTVEGWLNEWLENKAGSASKNTMLRYRQVIRDFLVHIGARAKASLTGLTPADFVAFRDTLRREGRAVSTCNMVIKKILSVPFEAARKMGYIPTNPTAGVDLLKDRSEDKKTGREPFSSDELMSLVATAEGDWRGAILVAATTGLRLGDIAGLRWGAIDLEAGLIRVEETEKTGATVVLPLHPDLEVWLADRPRGIGKAPVFPSLVEQNIGGSRGLSSQFRAIMQAAGVTGKMTEKKGNAGRTRYSKGFHSLRHTFVSQLANAGVHADIRQKLAGHADESVHKKYTHHELETLRDAVKKLPRIQIERAFA